MLWFVILILIVSTSYFATMSYLRGRENQHLRSDLDEVIQTSKGDIKMMLSLHDRLEEKEAELRNAHFSLEMVLEHDRKESEKVYDLGTTLMRILDD